MDSQLEEMPLFADAVGLGEPGSDFVIDLIHALETKGVQMISRRERFDSVETRICQATRQHNVAVDPIPANNKRGKTHSHLKCDPGFFG